MLYSYCLYPPCITFTLNLWDHKVEAVSHDNFDEPGNVVWEKEALISKEEYDNMVPMPINTFAKVTMYVKQAGQAYDFANVFANFTYNSDLNQRHVFKLKAFIPSYNVFIKAEGENWANKNLLKQVSMKLRDGTSSQPRVNQVEIKQQVTQPDRWVELSFDFGAFSSRTDLNRI